MYSVPTEKSPPRVGLAVGFVGNGAQLCSLCGDEFSPVAGFALTEIVADGVAPVCEACARMNDLPMVEHFRRFVAARGAPADAGIVTAAARVRERAILDGGVR